MSPAEVAGELIGADGVIRVYLLARCELSLVMITLCVVLGVEVFNAHGWRRG